MKKNKFVLAGIFALCLGSCADFLDVVPDNVATIDYAFRNRASAEKYLYTCYSYRPAIGNVNDDPGINGSNESAQRYSTQNFWPNLANSWIARGYQTSNEVFLNYWDGGNVRQPWGALPSLWVGIRDCNIFLEEIDKVLELTDYEKKRWCAEVKFLKAYYHYYLMKMYGPIPIVDVNLPISASAEDVKVYREPIDKVVEYIADLMKEAADELPVGVLEGTEAGRVDNLVALTMRAEVLLYAASPLFNGNTDLVSLVDKRGIALFPQKKDETKWQKAADACLEAITACHDGKKALQKDPDPMAVNDTFKLETVYRQAICKRWNTELIWGSTNYDYSRLSQYAMPRVERLGDRINECVSEWAPTINLVEKYYSAHGVPISEDKEWADSTWYANRFKIREEPATEGERNYVKKGEQTVYLHFNREPRFYASIGFDQGIYYGNGKYDKDGDEQPWCEFLNFKKSGFQAGSGYSITGYSAKKAHHYQFAQSSTGVNRGEWFPFPILRLADLYLMYAEALNEAQGPVADVFKYLDAVRARAGLEGVVASWEKYSTDPTRPTRSKEELRKIIHQERTIELALEGKRFWDIRRWKELDEIKELPQGWTIQGETKEDFYNVTTVPTYKATFSIKDYFWPIRESNLSVNSNLIQNYGW